MNVAKDHKARFGYEPDWSEHRAKQNTIAENRQEKQERQLRARRKERPWEPAR